MSSCQAEAGGSAGYLLDPSQGKEEGTGIEWPTRNSQGSKDCPKGSNLGGASCLSLPAKEDGPCPVEEPALLFLAHFLGEMDLTMFQPHLPLSSASTSKTTLLFYLQVTSFFLYSFSSPPHAPKCQPRRYSHCEPRMCLLNVYIYLLS